jgi:hypothetical protein
MTADLVLAVVGVSAGTGSAVGAWAALWWRDRVPFGHRQLLRHVFIHVDDRIGATKTENLRRANRRFRVIHKRTWYWWLVPNTKKLPVRRGIADYFWAVPQLGTGTSALPSTKRMGRYVTLELRGQATFRKPYRLWNIQAVVVRPTSEVDVHVAGFETSLARWVAWALRLTGPDQVTVEPHPELGYWRLSRKAAPVEIPTTMPVGVNADA